MSVIDPVLDGRFTLWVQELAAWGYLVGTPPQRPWLPNQILVHARRPPEAGPPTTITVAEQWNPGVSDPVVRGQLGLARENCTFTAASWHAQIDHDARDAATRALRLDVDPTKPEELRIHLHPFERPNDVRDPVPTLTEPGDWIDTVEATILDHT